MRYQSLWQRIDPAAGSGRRVGSPGVAGRGTRATELLSRLGIAHSVHGYEHDPQRGSFGLEASAALGVEPERVFKTLIADVDDQLTVAVVPVAGRLDLKALAGAAGGRRAAPATRGTARPASEEAFHDPGVFGVAGDANAPGS
jgi:Aminoacyl-tRNA editing domain